MTRAIWLAIGILLLGAIAPGVRVQADQPKTDLRLLEAVKTGDNAAAAALLRQHVNVNTAEADGTTALHWAVRQGAFDLADKLLRAGADVNAAMIERLLKAGADANFAGPEGETALMTAARTGTIEAARVLLAHGAQVDARESWRGQTALMWAAAQRHPAMVKELIAHGAD